MKKTTGTLTDILKKTKPEKVDRYIEENAEEMFFDSRPFSSYMRSLIREKGVRLQDVFLLADISEGYGYKLISGEKHTRQRDVILRICYAGELTLEETQRALRKYEMPELYAKIPRDALLMILFQDRPGSILDVNTLLKNKGMEPLRTSGLQD